jgi:hypothetical protein
MKYALLLVSLLYGSNSLATPIWQVKNKAGGVITLHDTLCKTKQGLYIETIAHKQRFTGCYIQKEGFVYVIWEDKSTDLYLSSDFYPVIAL